MSSCGSPPYALGPPRVFLLGDPGLGEGPPRCVRCLLAQSGDFSPTSTRSTTSVPKARANGVSSVADLRVVLYAIIPRGDTLPIFLLGLLIWFSVLPLESL